MFSRKFVVATFDHSRKSAVARQELMVDSARRQAVNERVTGLASFLVEFSIVRGFVAPCHAKGTVSGSFRRFV